MAKKAALVGCNYPRTESELHGCVNDVWNMRQLLLEKYGFYEENIMVLIDTDDNYIEPTCANIRQALHDLISESTVGDILYFHYSGHGTRVPIEDGENDETGYDECIVPCDLNLINDDEFRSLVNKLPPDVKLTTVSDSGHSSGLIENTKEQIGEGYGNYEDGSAFTNNIDDGSYNRDDVEIKNKSLPLNILLDMLKQKSGKDDVRVGNIRTTLFDMFRDDASSTVKKFVRSLMGGEINEQGGDGFIGLVGSVATQIVKQIAEDEQIADNSYAKHDGGGDNNSDDGSLMGGDNNEQGGGGFIGLVGSVATQIVKQIVEDEPIAYNSYVKQEDGGDNNNDNGSLMGGDNNEHAGGWFTRLVGSLATQVFNQTPKDESSEDNSYVRQEDGGVNDSDDGSLMKGDNNEHREGGFVGLVESLATQIVKQIAEDEPIVDNSYVKQEDGRDNNSNDGSLKGGDNNEQGGGGFIGLVGSVATQIVKQIAEDEPIEDNSYVKHEDGGDNNSDDGSLMGGDNNEQGGGGFIGLVGSVATQIVKQIVEDEPIADNSYANNNSDDSSPKGGANNEQGGGFMGLVGSLATQIVKQIAKDEPIVNNIYAKRENSGLIQGSDMGILVSGCQSSQTSIDINNGNGGDSYGALSNAIKTIIESAPPDEPITNRQLVTQVRELLASKGYTQRPGLYCTDENADAPFICLA